MLGIQLTKANISGWAKHWPYALAAVVLVSLGWAKDFYEQQLALVLWLALSGVALAARRTYRLPLIFVGIYLAFRCLWGLLESRGMGVELWLTTSVLSLRATAFLFALVAWATAAARGHFRIEAKTFFGLGVPLAALSTIAGFPLLGANLSLNAALLVACLPFVEMNDDVGSPTFLSDFARYWATHLTVMTVVWFFQSGTTAHAMLLAYCCLRFFGWVGLLVAAAASLVMFYFSTASLGESSRLEFWELAIVYAREHSNPWIGTGLGTFVAYGPLIQRASDFTKGGTWLSLHSDWLQLQFELGILGSWLGGIIFGSSIGAAPDRATCISLLLMGICALGYFPMEVPLMAAFCVWLVVRAQLKPVFVLEPGERVVDFGANACLNTFLRKCYEQRREVKV